MLVAPAPAGVQTYTEKQGHNFTLNATLENIKNDDAYDFTIEVFYHFSRCNCFSLYSFHYTVDSLT